MGLAQYNGSFDLKTVRKWFNGTTTLRRGQIMTYVDTATFNNTNPLLRLGIQVGAITAGSINLTAGFVTAGDAGRVGPCFVELIVPQSGDVFSAEVEGTTDIAIGSALEPDATLGALIGGTIAAGESAFRALQVFTDTARTVILIYKT